MVQDYYWKQRRYTQQQWATTSEEQWALPVSTTRSLPHSDRLLPEWHWLHTPHTWLPSWWGHWAAWPRSRGWRACGRGRPEPGHGFRPRRQSHPSSVGPVSTMPIELCIYMHMYLYLPDIQQGLWRTVRINKLYVVDWLGIPEWVCQSTT